MRMSFLTIFSAPKPFDRLHISIIQRNAIRSWIELGKEVEVILLGDESGIAETAREFGVRHIAEIKRNSQGTPLLDSIFDLAAENSDSPVLAYLNSDILVLPNFLNTAREVSQQTKEYLIVGQRWDLDITRELDFSSGWQAGLWRNCQENGRLHPRGGSDYFIYPRGAFQNMPAFALGRAGWDNWMIYEGRKRGWKVIDATSSVDIIHQTHDYNHLPDGKPHYKLPESFDNLRMAGGKQVIFTLNDANSIIEKGQVKLQPVTWTKFWREVEIFPLLSLNSNLLAQVFYRIFHPVKTMKEVRVWLVKFK